MPEPPHCIGQDLLLPQTMAQSSDDDEPDDTDDEDDTEAVDEAEENNMIKKVLEEDEVLGKILTDNGKKSGKWCQSPDKLESVLKYPYAGMDDKSGQIMPLISVAAINPGPHETDYKKQSTTESPVEMQSSTAPTAESVTDGEVITSNTSSDANAVTSSQLVDATGQIDKKGLHRPGAEIIFRCVPVPGPGRFAHRFIRKTTWKLTCEEDGWVGRPQPCEDDEDTGIEELANRTCIFAPDITKGENVLAFDGDKVLEDYEEFEPGAVLTFRCVDIGKYAMSGSATRRCTYGDWDGTRYVVSSGHYYHYVA